MTPEDEIQLQQKAQATFGKSLAQLSEQEMGLLFDDYRGKQQLYDEMAMSDMPQGQAVGGLHLAPGWGEMIGAGAQKLMGAYMGGKAVEIRPPAGRSPPRSRHGRRSWPTSAAVKKLHAPRKRGASG